MPHFEYTASDRTGAIAKGELEAKDKASATQALGSRGLFVLEIKPLAGSSQSPSAVPTDSPPPKARAAAVTKPSASTIITTGEKKRSPRRARWSNLQRALYLRQLSALFEAGIPLHHATHLLTENKEYSGELQATLGEVGLDLERGRLLSKSLERSRLFSGLIVSSVRIGEQSGGLNKILKRLADSEEQTLKLKRTLISRLTYPFVILIIMIVGVVVLGHVMSGVLSSIPNFKPEDVPLFGMLTAAFGHPAFMPLCLFLALISGGLAWKVYRTPAWRLLAESQIFRTPVVGSLLRRIEASQVTRLLSLLVKSGVTLDRALELCVDPVWTLSFKKALQECRSDIRNGTELRSKLLLFRSLSIGCDRHDHGRAGFRSAGKLAEQGRRLLLRSGGAHSRDGSGPDRTSIDRIFRYHYRGRYSRTFVPVFNSLQNI